MAADVMAARTSSSASSVYDSFVALLDDARTSSSASSVYGPFVTLVRSRTRQLHNHVSFPDIRNTLTTDRYHVPLEGRNQRTSSASALSRPEDQLALTQDATCQLLPMMASHCHTQPLRDTEHPQKWLPMRQNGPHADDGAYALFVASRLLSVFVLFIGLLLILMQRRRLYLERRARYRRVLAMD